MVRNSHTHTHTHKSNRIRETDLVVSKQINTHVSAHQKHNTTSAKVVPVTYDLHNVIGPYFSIDTHSLLQVPMFNPMSPPAGIVLDKLKF